MNTHSVKKQAAENFTVDWVEIARHLGKTFAKRASGYDETGDFVSENYQDLKKYFVFSAGIPVELGGGGATYKNLSDIIREIGKNCGSTALALAMHTHPLALNVFKHLHGDEGATRTLAKLAENELVIANTGANDWMESSGTAEKVEGGYRVSAHKRFVSGSSGAQIFSTSAVYDNPEGKEILHFALPFNTEGISVVQTWNALGMRGTGSHDVVLESVFVPDAAIAARRPAGVWHPIWNVVLPTALPLIASAYVGMAEAAVELAITSARFRQAELASVVGEMSNSLTTAQVMLADMVRTNDNHGFTPTMELANETLKRKTIIAESVKKTIELAADLVGGPGFFKGHAMERIVRDVRAIHYHPLPIRRQQIFSGRVALGFDPVSD